MEERFSNPAKVNAGNRRECLKSRVDSLERLFGHPADRLLPSIAETGDAIQIACDGRLDIDFCQMRHRAVEFDKVMTFIQTDFCTRMQTILLGDFWRQN